MVTVVAGISAAWFAAGSTGFLAHPLQHALTWLALAVAIAAAWPKRIDLPAGWAVLVGGAALGLLLTAVASPVVNTLAVAVVLAAIAHTQRELAGRAVLIAAMAAGGLGLFRLAYTAIPTVWLCKDIASRLVGQCVGRLTGCPLEVGVSYAGMDFLVLMSAVYAGWLFWTQPPRRTRAFYGAAAILLGYLAYLTLLAYSAQLLAALPEAAAPPISDENHVGQWTWEGGLRTLIPWNLPLAALVIQAAIAAMMFRWADWQPVAELDSEKAKRQREQEAKQEMSGLAIVRDMLLQFGPAVLAASIPVAIMLATVAPTLKDKTIVAYDKGRLNWDKPEYEKPVMGLYGMLPVFVESLGGRFARSADLTEKDLAEADVLVLIHPDQPWPKETLDRIWDYVRRGGSLLVAADPRVDQGDSHSSFNDVLQPTAMQVRSDTAIGRAAHWEQSLEATPHPATMGIRDLGNPFGLAAGASIQIRWPACSVLVGRWGWSEPGSDAASSAGRSYGPGKQLGDLVLAAEQPFGQGRIFVIGDTSPLRNEMLAVAYPFTGRLLAYLAQKTVSPQAGWRQLLGALAIIALVVLLAWRPNALQVGLSAALLATSIFCCAATTEHSSRILPDGRLHKPNNVAYVDASHSDAFSASLWSPRGVAGLLRTLMRDGYLPLMAYDTSRERMERASLWVSTAPGRSFSTDDRATLQQFLGNEGTFICMTGAEDAHVIGPMLKEEFGIIVPLSPVLPGETARESSPLGTFQQVFSESGGKSRAVSFCGAWPVEFDPSRGNEMVAWSDGKQHHAVVVGQPTTHGVVSVIGATHFAVNENLESLGDSLPDNIRFWRWLLSRVVVGRQEWDPPADLRDEPRSVQSASEPAQAAGQ
jgi:hypothetical protein